MTELHILNELKVINQVAGGIFTTLSPTRHARTEFEPLEQRRGVTARIATDKTEGLR